MRVLARRAYSLALVRMRRFEIQNERSALLLDEVVADVSSQLDAQARVGVQIRREDEVPEVGPTNGGLWCQVPGVTAVFADLKGSTDLNANDGPQSAAYANTYFIRAMAGTMDRFSAGYVDIQGGRHIWFVQRSVLRVPGDGLRDNDEDPDAAGHCRPVSEKCQVGLGAVRRTGYRSGHIVGAEARSERDEDV